MGRKREIDNLQGDHTETGTTLLAPQKLEKKKGSFTRGLELVPKVKGCTSLGSVHFKQFLLRYAGVQFTLPKSHPEKSYLKRNLN